VVLSIFFVLGVSVFPVLSSFAQAIIVKEIDVQGNRRVQETLIRGRIQTKVGDPFVPSRLAEDIKSVFGLGFFDDVQLKVEEFEGGVKVTFVVAEHPLISELRFEGNSEVKTQELEEKVEVKVGTLYNPVEVQKARDRIQEIYEEQGFFEVQVSPEVQKRDTDAVQVTLKITEGRKIRIDKIVIEGAQGLKPSSIKSIMQTQERQYFILRGTVQRQLLDQDLERIVLYYLDHGYLQARVESHELVVDRSRALVTIRIKVVEGPQFRLGTIDVRGATVLPEGEVRRQLTLKPGEVFNRSKIYQNSQAIVSLYSNIGRAAAEALPDTQVHSDSRTVDLTFEIKEGPETFVERINISGNTRSSEKILRRELALSEGDLFTTQKLNRSRQRLLNLGFFDEVNITTAPGSSGEKIVMNIEVKERATGMFSAGVGFSSVDQLVGTIDLSQRNLFGRGQELFLRLRVGARTQIGHIGFTEPWLFDRPLTAGFDISETRREFNDFSQESTAFSLRASHPFLDFWRAYLTYKLSKDEVSDVVASASGALQEQVGKSITSAISLSLVRDSRDNIYEPTSGGRLGFTTDLAGLGGDNHFTKLIAEITHFRPLWWGTVLGLRLETGYAAGLLGDRVPIFERFFLGGPNSVRSVKARSIGPVDENNEVIGGTSEILFNAEYIIPLVFRFRLAGFFDAGNAYGFDQKFDPTDLRYAAGVGLRWFSPFGPLRVDWGYNLNPKGNEKKSQFQFSVGSPF
jgi:outer membrane protein insertion porin family